MKFSLLLPIISTLQICVVIASIQYTDRNRAQHDSLTEVASSSRDSIVRLRYTPKARAEPALFRLLSTSLGSGAYFDSVPVTPTAFIQTSIASPATAAELASQQSTTLQPQTSTTTMSGADMASTSLSVSSNGGDTQKSTFSTTLVAVIALGSAFCLVLLVIALDQWWNRDKNCKGKDREWGSATGLQRSDAFRMSNNFRYSSDSRSITSSRSRDRRG